MVLAVALLAAQPASGVAAMDLLSYISELEHTAAAIRGADSREAAALSVPEAWTVSVDGQSIRVDTRWIHQELAAGGAQSWPSVRARVASRLDAMRLEAVEQRTEIRGDPQMALAEILARREFQRAQGSTWLEQLRQRISGWLEQVLSRIVGSTLGSRAVAAVFAWIASAVALLALALWLASVTTRRSRATVLELDPAARRAAAREWALRAVAAARSGDLREAVRCGYHAAVQRLDEQGVWTIDDARTPREYMRLLTGDDPRRAALGDLTSRFEQVWYGCRTATGDDARHVAAHLERLGCLRPGEQTN